MNNEHIRHLLLKFYEGQTTSDEEDELKRFFDSHNIPEELYADKILFLNMKQLNEKETKHIARMKQHMEQKIDRWEEETKVRTSRPFGIIKRYIIYATGIAAALAITYNRINFPMNNAVLFKQSKVFRQIGICDGWKLLLDFMETQRAFGKQKDDHHRPLPLDNL